MRSPITALPSPNETFHRDLALTSVLEKVLTQCDLPPELYRKAEQHYREKTDHLKQCPFLRRFEVVMKPQGSASIGTTVPPVQRKAGEFDVDLILAIEATSRDTQPRDLHRTIGEYLKLEYERELTAIRFGWQLDYALEDRMHFDIVPAIRWEHPREGRILAAPNWADREWKLTHPEGYTTEFLKQCDALPLFEEELLAIANSARSIEAYSAHTPKVEPLPAVSGIKKPLQRIVQLTKRHRDLWYSRRPGKALERRPASIVITTILWYAYARSVAGHSFNSVYAIFLRMAESLTDDRILLQLRDKDEVTYVLPNPTLHEENLVAKWNDPARARQVEEYFLWAKDYLAFIRALPEQRGRHHLQQVLTEGLGESPVSAAFSQETAALKPGASSRDQFGFSPGLGLLPTVVASGAPLPPHTFHGR